MAWLLPNSFPLQTVTRQRGTDQMFHIALCVNLRQHRDKIQLPCVNLLHYIDPSIHNDLELSIKYKMINRLKEFVTSAEVVSKKYQYFLKLKKPIVVEELKLGRTQIHDIANCVYY